MIFSKISKYRKYQKYDDIFDIYQIFSIFYIFLKRELVTRAGLLNKLLNHAEMAKHIVF